MGKNKKSRAESRAGNKPRTNLTLATDIKQMAAEMSAADHRPSLVNFIEALILKEAARRLPAGTNDKKVA